MKFCDTCGEEIYTKDGENTCTKCEDAAEFSKAKKAAARKKANSARKARESALRSLGLTKVRGSMGGVYWE